MNDDFPGVTVSSSHDGILEQQRKSLFERYGYEEYEFYESILYENRSGSLTIGTRLQTVDDDPFIFQNQCDVINSTIEV